MNTDDPDFLERLRAATELLEAVAADRICSERVPKDDWKRLKQSVARVHAPDRTARRMRRSVLKRTTREDKHRRDDEVLHSTGIRELRRRPVFTTPNYFPPEGFVAQDRDADESERREAVEPLHCYVCKQKFSRIDRFYDQLCPECAAFNFAKRTELADLSGRVALLTGGRVKIGYQAGLKLLRCGAHLIVTTRFPRDSAQRYAKEPDFDQWGHRLEIFGLDLRHTPSVEAFCRELVATHPRLDFIVNNACQTVRRPPEVYAHMMAGETAALREMPEHARSLVGRYEGLRSYEGIDAPGAMQSASAKLADLAGLTHAAELSQVPLLPDELLGQKHLFPDGQLDQ
ncbi:MAG TPA: SDR family NAD(P)-dependent oxidoreductase, partial [Candidatus Saccharimonadia bacterium]|nr:SDR family NAD(P)-dependent oxidoreductase [Candidatus Saccharimonadia bacterium]